MAVSVPTRLTASAPPVEATEGRELGPLAVGERPCAVGARFAGRERAKRV